MLHQLFPLPASFRYIENKTLAYENMCWFSIVTWKKTFAPCVFIYYIVYLFNLYMPGTFLFNHLLMLQIVTNSGRASTLAATDAATPTLRRIERAAIAAATPISYHSRYFSKSLKYCTCMNQ